MQIYEQANGRWALQADDGAIRTFDTEQEARRAMAGTAIETFEQMYGQTRAGAKALLGLLREIQTHRRANPQIAAAVAATEPGQFVAGGTMPKEAYETAFLLFDKLATFIGSELIEGSGITIEDAVYRMG